jgi:AraC family transcriptional activator of pobA
MVHCESIAARSQLHNWQITPHKHNGLFQVLHLQGGGAQVQIDDAHYEMAPGQVLMVPQMCVHGFRFERDAVGHVVTLAYPLMHRLAGQAGDALLALASPRMHALGGDEESGYIRMAFHALDAEYRKLAPHRTQLIESVLAAILIWLSRSTAQHTLGHAPGTGRKGEHFSNFCQLIEQHYTSHQPLSFYAQRLGITAAHLNALCRETVGKTALELIHERVILEAKRHLVYTSMSISVVSYTVGFSDPAYFTRFFKRQVGLSPKEFRERVGT